MIVKTQRTWAEVDGLSGEWNHLLQRSHEASIFRTWEWLDAWRSVIGDAVEPYIITVRDDSGRLLGIAPLYLASIRLLGVVKLRTLRFVADVATGSEYPDWIVDRSVDVEVSNEISRQLAANTGEWDTIWLSKVSGWTHAQHRIFRSAQQNGLLVRTRPCAFSTVSLPAEMADFESAFSARRRQQMRRNLRRVENLEGIEFVRCENRQQLPEFLSALFDLHQRRWEAAGIDGCFQRKPAEESFYREFAPVAFDNDWLALFGVKQNGVFKAVQFGYAYNGSFLQLQEGYDPDFPHSVGNALRHYVFRECIDAGLKEYDFLAGLSEHKRRWAAEMREGYDILISSRALKSRLMMAGGVWPTGRFVEQLGLVTS